MKNILLPTDFSANSLHAIDHALQLFADETCTFYLLNTYTPVIYNMDYMQTRAAQFDLMETVKLASVERLTELVLKLKAKFNTNNHTIETISSFSTLTQEIKNVVDKKNIDYVVMGTQGATGAKEVLFGSNAVHVFKNATCPVLAIPKSAVFSKPEYVLFPTDFGVDYQDKNLMPFLNIVNKNSARVHVLHVSFGDALTEKQIANRATLKNYLGTIKHDFYDLRDEGVSPAIVDFQKKYPVDMLVMINNKHSFFENLFFKSRIDQIGFHIEIPFLVIPSYQ